MSVTSGNLGAQGGLKEVYCILEYPLMLQSMDEECRMSSLVKENKKPETSTVNFASKENLWYFPNEFVIWKWSVTLWHLSRGNQYLSIWLSLIIYLWVWFIYIFFINKTNLYCLTKAIIINIALSLISHVNSWNETEENGSLVYVISI